MAPDSIAISVDPQGAGGNGHTTPFFQDGQGQWYSFDQGAAGEAASSGDLGFLSGSNAPAGVVIERVSGPTEGVVLIPTTREQDVKIAASAFAIQEGHNAGKESYNLFSNNYTDAACTVVKNSGAGIAIENPGLIVRPNSYYDYLRERTALVPVPGGGFSGGLAPTDNTRVGAVRVAKYQVKL